MHEHDIKNACVCVCMRACVSCMSAYMCVRAKWQSQLYSQKHDNITMRALEDTLWSVICSKNSYYMFENKIFYLFH